MYKTINELMVDIKMCLNNEVCSCQALDEARDRGRVSRELLSMLTKKYKWIPKKVKTKKKKTLKTKSIS